MPNVHDLEDTTHVPSMPNSKDTPIIALVHYIEDIISRNYSYYYNFYHDFPTIDKDQLMVYKFVNE